jgi:hypothetical protein
VSSVGSAEEDRRPSMTVNSYLEVIGDELVKLVLNKMCEAWTESGRALQKPTEVKAVDQR